MEDQDLINILRNISIFKNLRDEQIAKMIDISTLKDFSAGDTIIKTGDPSSELFLIISGEFEVRNSLQKLATLKDSDIIGEMGIFTGEPRSADVQATRSSSVLVIAKNDLEKLIENDKEMGLTIYRNVITTLANHMKKNNIMLEFSYILE